MAGGRRGGICGCMFSPSICCVYEQDWQTHLHSFMTLKRSTAAQVRREESREQAEEVGRKRSRGTAFYIRLFISLLPSVIRNGRTLTPKHCASFQFHLAHNCLRKRAILQCPERHKKNYSCTKEFNCIVPSPVPTKGYSRISNEDGHPSDKGYF